jgi:hypothetical protein
MQNKKEQHAEFLCLNFAPFAFCRLLIEQTDLMKTSKQWKLQERRLNAMQDH